MDGEVNARENDMKIESNVPKKISKENIGMKILYRLPNNAIAIEGIIDDLSPEEDYISVKRRWIANDGNGILAILSGTQRRREAIK